MTTSAGIFDPFQLGDLQLPNRAVMAPMTRNRAARDGTVSDMMVSYYAQRAAAGLILTESAPISPRAIGYPFTPGIYTRAQAESWLRLTDAVHEQGGRIFIQLQHCGRISHTSLQPDNATPVAPSALKPEGQAVTYEGMQDFALPRELETNELPGIVAEFRNAAALAVEAGFDGVEVHGGNGYLVDQFLRDGTNRRTDAYGGSIANRMRLLNEILDAVCEVWPAARVGVRLTPENSFNSMSDSNPAEHFSYIIRALSERGLAFLDVLEGDMMTKSRELDYAKLKREFAGPYIANNGYDLLRAQDSLKRGDAELIAFGVPYLANPDLIDRYRRGLALNKADHSRFYGGDETGYTDYPVADSSKY